MIAITMRSSIRVKFHPENAFLSFFELVDFMILFILFCRNPCLFRLHGSDLVVACEHDPELSNETVRMPEFQITLCNTLLSE